MPQSRTLSTVLTFFLKFVLPPLWIVLFGEAVCSALFGGGRSSGSVAVLLLAWIAGTVLLWFSGMRLKRVRRVGSILRISNYRHEIAMPLSAVDRIEENRWIRGRPITVHFNRGTRFGTCIVFMPRTTMLMPSAVFAELELALREERYLRNGVRTQWKSREGNASSGSR